MYLDPYFMLYTKIISRCTEDLSVRLTVEYIHNLEVGKDCIKKDTKSYKIN